MTMPMMVSDQTHGKEYRNILYFNGDPFVFQMKEVQIFSINFTRHFFSRFPSTLGHNLGALIIKRHHNIVLQECL